MTALIRSKQAVTIAVAAISLFIAVGGCSSSSRAQNDGGASSGGKGGNAGETGGTGGNTASAGTGGGSAGTSASAGSGGSGGTSPTSGSNGPAGTVGAQGGAVGDASVPNGDSSGSAGGSPPPTGTPIETLHITPTGQMAASASLAKGELFLLRASGAIDLGGTKVDAEFASTDGTTGMDKVGAVDVGLDDGLKELILLGAGAAPPVAGPNRMKWFGAFRADHVYYMWITGTGAPVLLNLVKPDAAPAGTGSIDIAIYQLTPMPTGIGKSLETISVSIVSKAARSTSAMTTRIGAVYLLRSAGQGHVGGAGGVGDADFDDYNATATNANQGEGGADFGIGVDEACIALHKQKWGPYRMDHDYYMLYAGTGMPIVFSYCDTGYGDNTGSMPVELYAVP